MKREVSLVDLLDARKVNYCVRSRHKKYLNGERNFFPWSVEIHPTSKCNYECSYCAYSVRNTSNSSIPPDALKALWDVLTINETKGVFFSGGGEPLLYTGLSDHVDYLDRAGIKVSLLTNGSLVANEKYSQMLSSLDYIAISIPSLNEEEFKKMTGRNMSAQLIDLPHLIRANRRKVPIVGSRLVLCQENYKSAIETILKLKSSSYDYCIVKAPKDPEGRGLALEQEWLDFLKEEYSKNQEELSEDFTNIKALLEGPVKARPEGETCWAIEYGINCFIHTDGSVYLCLCDMGKKEFSIGNIKEENFDDIWRGHRRTEVVQQMNKRYQSMGCSGCRNVAYNNVIEKYPDSGFSKHMDPFL